MVRETFVFKFSMNLINMLVSVDYQDKRTLSRIVGDSVDAIVYFKNIIFRSINVTLFYRQNSTFLLHISRGMHSGSTLFIFKICIFFYYLNWEKPNYLRYLKHFAERIVFSGLWMICFWSSNKVLLNLSVVSDIFKIIQVCLKK